MFLFKFVLMLYRWVRSLVISFIFAYIFIVFIFSISIVQGESMEPTFYSGDRILVNKWIYYVEEPSYHDIIVFKLNKENKYLVKRVVGVSGDVIEIKNGTLYRNGVAVDESTYLANFYIEGEDYGPIRVKEGTVFVLGDNRKQNKSLDSRHSTVGLVDLKTVDGRVEMIVWPISRN